MAVQIREEKIIGGTAAAEYAGITYRQLDHWARRRVLVPSMSDSLGTGFPREYTVEDVLVLCVFRELARLGAQLSALGLAVEPIKAAIRDGVPWLLVSPTCEIVGITNENIAEVMVSHSTLAAWVLDLKSILKGCDLYQP